LKHIGWIEEYFEYLTNTLTDEEIVEITNEIINDLSTHRVDCIVTLEQVKNEYLEQNSICPECGSKEFTHKTVIEDTNADGQMGRPVTYAKCIKCGNEIGT
jgi:DNA-directed RNA polymerase subunit RPC12/RpoP